MDERKYRRLLATTPSTEGGGTRKERVGERLSGEATLLHIGTMLLGSKLKPPSEIMRRERLCKVVFSIIKLLTIRPPMEMGSVQFFLDGDPEVIASYLTRPRQVDFNESLLLNSCQ
jgi:hypothetical protein